jgi:5-methylcytosine-specific restriction endonuclease McrA
MPLHPALRQSLNIPASISDERVLRVWNARSRRYCKPCWELKYCPYGPLVEEFPLLPSSLRSAEEHQLYLKRCLADGRFPDGRALTAKHKKRFQEDIDAFDPAEHPAAFPRAIAEASCRVFGHLCPVYFVGEPLTETKDLRSHSRSIPRDVMLKVVRRDGQICQRCHEPVPDDQVEFDHIIPFSKGGASTVENLRLCCRGCNRRKSASLHDILSPNPIEHLATLRKRRKA